MKFAGLAFVLVCTFGGLMVAAGVEKAMHLITGAILPALPGEFIIIMGCAMCAFLVANPPHVVKYTMSYFKALKKPGAYTKEDYIELLSMMFTLFKLARTKGWLALEQHIENPHDSELFKQFPSFHHNHHATTFLCDYLRIISLGNENPLTIEALMDEEIETIKEHEGHPGHAVQSMADGIPALGIVAAVLGVIKTMSSISEPPEILGKMIGGALVGTFLGVFLAYGFVGPFATRVKAVIDEDQNFYNLIREVMVANLHNHAPNICVEVGRQNTPASVRPSYNELEGALRASKQGMAA